MPKPSAALPQVRSIVFTRPLTWLALGWRDMLRSGSASLVHGLALAVFGMLIAAVVAHDRFWLLAGATVGLSGGGPGAGHQLLCAEPCARAW
jgi:hypothetical protein